MAASSARSPGSEEVERDLQGVDVAPLPLQAVLDHDVERAAFTVDQPLGRVQDDVHQPIGVLLRGQGHADLVDAAEGLDVLLQVRRHLVEGLSQLLEFVATLDAHPFGESTPEIRWVALWSWSMGTMLRRIWERLTITMTRKDSRRVRAKMVLKSTDRAEYLAEGLALHDGQVGEVAGPHEEGAKLAMYWSASPRHSEAARALGAGAGPLDLVEGETLPEGGEQGLSDLIQGNDLGSRSVEVVVAPEVILGDLCEHQGPPGTGQVLSDGEVDRPRPLGRRDQEEAGRCPWRDGPSGRCRARAGQRGRPWRATTSSSAPTTAMDSKRGSIRALRGPNTPSRSRVGRPARVATMSTRSVSATCRLS